MFAQRCWIATISFFLLLSLYAGEVAASGWREQNLTQEEIAFLQKHPALKAGVGTAFPPIMFLDSDNGDSFEGMVSDYIRLIEERLQIDIQPVLDIPFKEALERGRVRAIDIFPCVADTVERRKFLSFTKPYLNYPLVIMTRDDEGFVSGVEGLAALRIATVKPLATYSKLINTYKKRQFNFVYRDTVPDVLKAVSLGNADACIINLAVAAYEINRQGLGNLKVAAPTPWKNNELGMAVRSDWPILRDIFDKALESITDSEHSEIQRKWINIKVSTPFDYSELMKWFLAGAALIVASFSLGTLWIRSLKKEINQRVLAESKLKESETSLILAAEENGLSLWDWDLESDCIHFKTLEKPTFSSCITEFKENWLKEIHSEDAEKAEAAFEQCNDGSCTRLDLEYRKLSVEGNIIWERMAGVVIGHADAPRRLLGFFQDITASKELLKKRALSDKLESIGEIAAGVAHEMNTPLHYIKGNLKYIGEVLEKAVMPAKEDEQEGGVLQFPGPNEMKRSLSDCAEAAYESIDGVERISKIINALKLVAHISDKKVSRYNLHDMIEKALTISENEWKYSSAVELEIDEELMVVCNPGDLIQLVTALLVNAAQAIKERHGSEHLGKINITAEVDGSALRLAVSDNGCGMNEVTQAKIFDPFFTTKDVGEGTGQGLYIAFNIAKKYGGTISCSSRLLEGTTFTLSLPDMVSL